MKCLFLLLMKFIVVLNLYSKDLYEYKFNWYPRIIVEDDVIVFPDFPNTKPTTQLVCGKIILVIMA